MRSDSRQSPSAFFATASASPCLLSTHGLESSMYEFVEQQDEIPHRTETGCEVEPAQRIGQPRVPRSPRRRAVDRPQRVGDDAAAVVHRHVQHTVREVAEVVRQVRVVTLHHRFVREVAVGSEALVGHEVVAEAVDPEVGDEVGRRDLVERVLLIFSPPTSSQPSANAARGGFEPQAAVDIAGQYTA